MGDGPGEKRPPEVPELFVRWFDFTNWLFDRTARFPKNMRHTLTNRVEVAALEILLGVVEARYDRENRAEKLSGVNMGLEKMRVLMRLCHARGYLSNPQYEHACREIDTAGRMAGGWKRHREAGRP